MHRSLSNSWPSLQHNLCRALNTSDFDVGPSRWYSHHVSASAISVGGGEPSSGESPKDLVQSVVRAFGLIDIVAESDEPMRAKVIAERAGLHLATTSHLLNTLVHVGYLSRRGREYTVGNHKILSLNAKVEDTWRPSRLAMSLLSRVVDQTGETAYLSAWHDGDVTVVSVEEGTHAVRVAGLRVGFSGSIHARASGKALLAFGWEDCVLRLADDNGRLPERTEYTMRTLDGLQQNLALIRERGYATDSQEFAVGVCGLGIPLFEGLKRPRAALAITVPLDRFRAPAHYEICLGAMLEARKIDADVD